jgi:hypothetical protein
MRSRASSPKVETFTIRTTTENTPKAGTHYYLIVVNLLLASPSSPVVVELENRVSKLEQLLVNLMHEKTNERSKGTCH